MYDPVRSALWNSGPQIFVYKIIINFHVKVPPNIIYASVLQSILFVMTISPRDVMPAYSPNKYKVLLNKKPF